MADPEERIQEIPTLEDLACDADSDPNNLNIQYRYGRALFAAEQNEEAQKIFRNTSTRWPDEIEIQ